MSLLPFLIFAFVASITPGPTNILVLANSQHFGVKNTVPAILGGCAAASAIVLISGAGAGEILRQYPLIRQVMSWAGVLWLSFLSWQLFNAPAANIAGVSHQRFTARAAALLQVINPKTWMMALAVVSVFADQGGQRQVAYLSLMFFLIALPCLGAWALLGAGSSRLLRSPSTLQAFNRIMALLLLGSAWLSVLL